MDETILEMARRHVAEGERVIAQQEAKLEQLRQQGFDTSEIERALETFRKTLGEIRAHLAHLESVDQRGPSGGND